MKRKVISMILRRWKGFCLAAEEEALFPQGAEMCGEVFAPLVFLVRRDPLRARGLYPIRDLSELDEPEGIGCLTPSSPAEGELAAFVRAHERRQLPFRRGRRGQAADALGLIQLGQVPDGIQAARAQRIAPHQKHQRRKHLAAHLRPLREQSLLLCRQAEALPSSQDHADHLSFHIFPNGSPSRGRFPLSGGNVPKGQKG